MKRSLLLLGTFLVLWVTTASGQTRPQQLFFNRSFESDSISKTSFFRTLEGNLKLTALKDSKAEVEVRLLTIPATLTEGSLLAIKSNGADWQATEYKYFYKSDENGKRKGRYRYVVDEKIAAENWDTFWAKALENNLLTLPGQAGLQEKMRAAFASVNWNEQVVEQSQIKPQAGTGYYLEIKVGDKFRYYGYEVDDQQAATSEINAVISLFSHLIRQEIASL